jgi:hypothetical protein
MADQPTDEFMQVEKTLAESRRLRQEAKAARDAAQRAYEAVHRFYGRERRKRHRADATQGWERPERRGDT